LQEEEKMQIVVSGKNVELSPSLKDYIEKKLVRLEKYLGEPIMIQVVLSTERFRNIVDITVSAKEGVFHTSEDMDDMYAAIDKAVDVMEEMVRRKKEKIKNIPKGRDNRESTVGENLGASLGEEEIRIVEESIDVKPMSIDEALLQIGEDDKGFVVFINSDTGRVNVLYRKRKNLFGLITL
jgi:putative sigma-54 modulation protein